MFKRIAQIGVVVRNAEQSARRCRNDFGLGPWTFYTLNPGNVADMKIHGLRVDHAMRTAHASISGIDWELIEPLDEMSIYAEHLRTHGEGLHHVLFDLEDYAASREKLAGLGYEEVVSGNYEGAPYSYFDARTSLGCLVEIWSPWRGAAPVKPEMTLT